MMNKDKEELRFAQQYMDERPEELMMESLLETACPEGCWVEPDGECPHGFRSPLLVLGVI
ncbi:MAG: hypothetical protein ACNA8H_05575 [Anaerolineales bacterium]